LINKFSNLIIWGRGNLVPFLLNLTPLPVMVVKKFYLCIVIRLIILRSMRKLWAVWKVKLIVRLRVII